MSATTQQRYESLQDDKMTKPIRSHRFLIGGLVAAAMISSGSSALALSGTMTASGNWSDGTKWSGGIIADGENNTATINASVTGTVNTNRSIGNIIFNNASTLNSSGGSTLTLAVSTGIPNIRTTFRGRKGTISAPIGGNDGLQSNWPGGTLANVGTIVLSGNNIYSGGTFLVAGEIHIGHVNALSTGTITFGGGGLASSDGTAYTITNTIAITGNVVIGKYHSDDVAPGTGALTFSDTAATALGANRTFTVYPGLKATFAQAFSGVNAITKAGSGTLVVTGASTYDGVTTISSSGGTLEISSIGSVNGSASNLGIPTTAAKGKIYIGNGGTLVYTGTGATTDRQLATSGVTSTFTVDQSGSGLLKFTSAVSPGSNGGLITLNLQGSTTGRGEISGIIPNTSGTRLTAVTKAGSGTWTLSGANTYTGNTTVNAGTLALGATGALNANSKVYLAGGTLSAGDFSNSLGTLTLSTGSSSIELGSGTLSFLNSSALVWSGTLDLTGTLGSTTLRFGTDASGLTQAQLDRITYNSRPVTLTEQGHIKAVPPAGPVFTVW